jgi:hypothetical protein
VPVLSPGAGKTKTGRLWAYVRDDRPAGDATPPAVWFRYSPDRRGQHPQAHLKGYAGVLQTDAYAGFNDDLPLIQQAAKNGWEVEIQLEGVAGGDWPPLPSTLKISHLSNTVDHENHTFAFFLPLENQWQTYTQGGQPRLLWRFRPGNHVRLRVPVEKMEDVFVVPKESVVREGPEAYVFRQNGSLFDRRPVHVLHEDRRFAVLANDGAVRAGAYVPQSGAASINRVLKAQSSSGQPAGVHVHADGSVHGAH